MNVRRTPTERGASGETLSAGAIDDEAATSQAFRSHAERLLRKADSMDDIAARAGLIVEAALLHRLAVVYETREQAPLELYETATFARSRVDAQLMGGGKGRGLRGDPRHLERARDAYEASDRPGDWSAHEQRKL